MRPWPNNALAVDGGIPSRLHIGCAWPATTTEAHRSLMCER
jgi:hypothetical protein